jgi:diadenosine tetraphosphate (Ap4A) HIT family hydrolase
MSDCLFCRIVTGDVEASVAYRDDQVMGLMDLSPVSPGHLLVIPVEHHTAITDLPDSLGHAMWSLATHVARILRAEVDGVEGVNVLISEGAVAQQHVFHSHLHVIPRRTGDGMVLTSPDATADRADLDAMAAQLGTALVHRAG